MMFLDDEPTVEELFPVIDEEEPETVEPKNNDGRSVCYWCKVPTVKWGWIRFFHDECPVCHR